MKYYVIQVKTGAEEKYIELFEAYAFGVNVKLYFPKRELVERKQRKTAKIIRPVFSGYVFLETEDSCRIQDIQHLFKKAAGFFRFLHSNIDIAELSGKDLDIILCFIKNIGQIAGISKVYFNEQDKIVVNSGPLIGLEGAIIKVDKRKGRAKVKLDFFNNVFTVDLGFEVLTGGKKQ